MNPNSDKIFQFNLRYKDYENKIGQLHNNLKCDIMSVDEVYEKQKNLKKALLKELLKIHPYPIKQMNSEKDSRWYTHYYDSVTKTRKTLKKSSQEEIYNALLMVYHLEENPRTLKTLYGSFLEYKALRLPKESSTIHRIDCDYRKYYQNNEIIDIPIHKLTREYIENWAYKMIRDKNLTKKQYSNMITILKGILEYSLYMHYIERNPYVDVKINSKNFRQELKAKSSTQVFLIDEQPLIEKTALDLFQETNDVGYLAIILNFQLGLRIGELVALEYSDIENNILHIQKEEVKYKPILDDKGNFGSYVKEIVNHTKGYEDRDVYITPTASSLFQKIKKANMKNGFYDGDYIFVGKNGRYHIRALDNKLRKCCIKAGVDIKSFHKIRKTYGSTLLDNNVNIEDVRLALGHKDERTTYHNYIYSRYSDTQKHDLFSKALKSSVI